MIFMYNFAIHLYKSKSGVAVGHLICLLLSSIFPKSNIYVYVGVSNGGILEKCHTWAEVSNLYLPYALGTKSSSQAFHTHGI